MDGGSVGKRKHELQLHFEEPFLPKSAPDTHPVGASAWCCLSCCQLQGVDDRGAAVKLCGANGPGYVPPLFRRTPSS